MIGFNGRNLGAKLNIIKQRSPFVLVNICMIDIIVRKEILLWLRSLYPHGMLIKIN